MRNLNEMIKAKKEGRLEGEPFNYSLILLKFISEIKSAGFTFKKEAHLTYSLLPSKWLEYTFVSENKYYININIFINKDEYLQVHLSASGIIVKNNDDSVTYSENGKYFSLKEIELDEAFAMVEELSKKMILTYE